MSQEKIQRLLLQATSYEREAIATDDGTTALDYRIAAARARAQAAYWARRERGFP